MNWGKLGKPLNDPPRKPDLDLEEDHFQCAHCGKRFIFESTAMMHLRNCEKRPARQGKIMRSEVKDLK